MLNIGDPELDFEKLFLGRKGKNDLKTDGLAQGQTGIFSDRNGVWGALGVPQIVLFS